MQSGFALWPFLRKRFTKYLELIFIEVVSIEGSDSLELREILLCWLSSGVVLQDSARWQNPSLGEIGQVEQTLPCLSQICPLNQLPSSL